MEDLTAYLETHFEIVQFITRKENESSDNIVKRTASDSGTGGLYELAKKWTDEFEAKYKDTLWGEELDFFDTIEEFLEGKT